MGEEENLLERALRLVATDPASIPEFYGTLLNADVFILGEKDPHPVGNVVDLYARAGSQIYIRDTAMADGSTTIAFFSSLPALRLHIEQAEPYLRMTARDLFELTRGEDMFLNPASEYSKSFSAAEIDDLLREGLPNHHDREVIKEDARVLLGPPATPPTEIMDTLSRYFETDARVRAAYMAMIQFPDREDEPNLCAGVECDASNYDDICPAAVATISHLIGKERSILFFLVDPKNLDVPADYMYNEVEPFYRAAPKVPPSLGRRKRRSTLGFGKRIR